MADHAVVAKHGKLRIYADAEFYHVVHPMLPTTTIRRVQVRPMDPVRKLNWISQLLSGAYRQHRCELVSAKNHASRCCLGVAADLYPALVEAVDSLGMVRLGAPGEPPDRCVLTSTLRRWLTLTPKEQDLLVLLNDRGFSFEDIAFVISALF